MPGGAWDGITDEDLLASYLSGERREAAFAELVGRYERRIYAVCYRYFGDHSDAEDAAQDTFIAVARRAGTFSGGSRLSTWMYRVAVNSCNDLARRRARRPQTPVEDIAVVAEAAGVSHGHDEMSARELELEVQRALLELDDLSRTLVVLVTLEGLSYQEAGAAMDLPVGTVKSRVHRARARLAELLADVVGEVPPQPTRTVAPRPRPDG